MSRARTMELIALKQSITLQAHRREAKRLFDEIARLEARIAQIADLDRGYRDQLAHPEMHVTEYRDVLQIIGKLRERSDIDKARNEILDVERTRLRALLAEKKNSWRPRRRSRQAALPPMHNPRPRPPRRRTPRVTKRSQRSPPQRKSRREASP